MSLTHIKAHRIDEYDNPKIIPRMKQKYFDRAYEKCFLRDYKSLSLMGLLGLQQQGYELFWRGLSLTRATADFEFFDKGLKGFDFANATAASLVKGLMKKGDGNIEFYHAGKPYWVECIDKNKVLTGYNWGRLLCQAISRRDTESAKAILEFEPSLALEYADFPVPRYGAYVHYLQSMLTDGVDYQAVHEEFIRLYGLQMLPLYTSSLFPFYYLAIGEQPSFELGIREATKIHCQYAKKDEYHLDYTAKGHWPPLLIGAASLAYDRYGWELEHKNDYIPEWWAQNRFDPAEVELNVIV